MITLVELGAWMRKRGGVYAIEDSDDCELHRLGKEDIPFLMRRVLLTEPEKDRLRVACTQKGDDDAITALREMSGLLSEWEKLKMVAIEL